VTGALLALALAASPALAAAPGRVAPTPPAVAAPLAQDEDWEAPDEDEGERARHLFLSAWGGEAWGSGGSGPSYGNVGAEVAWAFGQLDLGIAGYQYRDLSPERAWTRVALVRATQRFPMRTGVEAAFGLGLGAARVAGWEGWFQIALGVRVPLGPLFLGGELSFERGDLLRLAGGLGLAF
jgi:hypothetical protein